MSKGRKNPIGQRVCERLDIPVGTLGKASFIEAVGSREITVSGCEGLLNYTDNEVVLRLCDGMVTVSGENLELRSFAGGRILVRGAVRCIRLGDEVGDDS